jgi:hypothetical protein
LRSSFSRAPWLLSFLAVQGFEPATLLRELHPLTTSPSGRASNHATFTAEEYRIRKIGAKKAGKKRRLEMQQSAYDLRPGLGEIIEIGIRLAVGEPEEKNLTWFALAHLMSSAANRQVHPGIKEAAQDRGVDAVDYDC